MSRRSIRHSRQHRHALREDVQAIPVARSMPFVDWLRHLLAAVFTARG